MNFLPKYFHKKKYVGDMNFSIGLNVEEKYFKRSNDLNSSI